MLRIAKAIKAAPVKPGNFWENELKLRKTVKKLVI